MPSSGTCSRFLCMGLLAILSQAWIRSASAQTPTGHQTQNIILVMIDGMRWQEVFRGADPSLLETLGSDMPGDAKQRADLARQRYSQPASAERRKTLMPF